MEFVILNTVSQHGLSTESSIVWVKHSSEQLIYGKSHVDLFFFFFFIFFFFFDGVTLNPNVTEQEGTDFFAKKSCAFIGSDNHVQILSMPSNAGVKSLSFISTPCKIYSHRNDHFFCLIVFYYFFFTENIQGWSRQPSRDGF